MQKFEKVAETLRPGPVGGLHTRVARDRVQLRHELAVQAPGRGEVPAAETQAHDRAAHGPVPLVMDREPFKWGLVAFEKLLAGVDEQTLAEASGT